MTAASQEIGFVENSFFRWGSYFFQDLVPAIAKKTFG